MAKHTLKIRPPENKGINLDTMWIGILLFDFEENGPAFDISFYPYRLIQVTKGLGINTFCPRHAGTLRKQW